MSNIVHKIYQVRKYENLKDIQRSVSIRPNVKIQNDEEEVGETSKLKASLSNVINEDIATDIPESWYFKFKEHIL